MEPKKHKIYIAGPIAGKDGYRLEFAAAAADWRRIGWHVENPVEIAAHMGIGDEATYDQLELLKRLELSVIPRCDAIYLLKGWNKSPGALRELQVALACGVTVIVSDDFAKELPNE